MKYIFYLIFSKIGIVFSGSGRSRLRSALSAFTKAQDELQMAMTHELKTINKTGNKLKRAKKAFEKKEKDLSDKTKAHEKTRKESMVYFNKIQNFLKIDEDINDAEPVETTSGVDTTDTADATPEDISVVTDAPGETSTLEGLDGTGAKDLADTDNVT